MSLIEGSYRKMSQKTKSSWQIKRTHCLSYGECGSTEFKYLTYNFYIRVLMSTDLYGITSGNNKKCHILEC